jgi:hypothetical protein
VGSVAGVLAGETQATEHLGGASDVLDGEPDLGGVGGQHCGDAGDQGVVAADVVFLGAGANGRSAGTSPHSKYDPKFHRACPTHFCAPRTFSTTIRMSRPAASDASRWMRKHASNSGLSDGGSALARDHGIAW